MALNDNKMHDMKLHRFWLIIVLMIASNAAVFAQSFNKSGLSIRTSNGGSGPYITRIEQTTNETIVHFTIPDQARRNKSGKVVGGPTFSVSRMTYLLPASGSFDLPSDFAEGIIAWNSDSDKLRSTLTPHRISYATGIELGTSYYMAGGTFKLHFNSDECRIPLGTSNFVLFELVLNSSGTQYILGYKWKSSLNIPYPSVGNVNMTESKIKEWIDDNNNGIYGIYKGTDTESSNAYTLAYINHLGQDVLVYLKADSYLSHWKIGDIKARLEPTATRGFYSAKWHMADKSSENNWYVSFEEGRMTTIRPNGYKELYIKMYPTFDGNTSSSSNSEKWSGTGFALKDGYIITNHHVIDGAKSISIYGVQGNFEQSLNATVIATDAHNDLALLKVTDSKFNGFGTIPYAVKNLMAEVGEEVFVLGYPMTQYMGNEIKLTNGLISSRSGFQGDISTYQISAPVQPGNSGGPLFDKKGNIVGVVNAGIPGAENVGYAIKVSYMNNLIETAVSTSILPTINQLTNLTLSQQVSKVKDFVYYIECSSSEKETYVKQPTSVAQSHSQSENSNSYNATSQTSVSGDWISFYNSGLEKARARDYEGAYKDFCKSCECERNEKNEYLKSYVAVQLRLWEEAYQSAKFAVDNGNDDADNVLAVAAQNTRRYDEAIRQFTKIIEKNAQDVWAIHGRAWCYELTKDWEKCIADCRMALKYEKTEDFDYSRIYNELAWALVNVNKPADALDPIKKAIKLDHTQGNYWDTEAEAKYKTGDYIGCISSATNAIAIGKTKDNASWLDNSYYWRGMAKKQIGDMAGAFQDLESSIECAEDDEDFETKAQSALSSIDASIIDFSIGNFAIKYENLAITKQREDKILLNIVELTSDYTALYLEYKNTEYAEGGWYNISKDAYVRDKATGKKYRCIATENCAFAPYQTPIELNETKIFILYFEALPESANKIDFIESTTSDWQFYDIILK